MRYAKHMVPTISKLKQKLAYEIRIIGLQKAPAENAPNCKSYFYKFAFDACDRFNRNLHDRSWPHARSGRGTRGDFLNQHDFAMAVLLQNVFALFDELNESYDNSVVSWKFDGTDTVDPERVGSFCNKCLRLADELFIDSLNLIPAEISL